MFNFQKRHYLYFVGVFAGLVFTVFIANDPYRVRAAVFFWDTFHNAPLAFSLNKDAHLALSVGNYYFNVGGEGEYNLKKAKKYFHKAIVLDPSVPDAWHQLARIDFLRGDFNKALKKINTQIDLHGESLMASYYIRGLISGYDAMQKNSLPRVQKKEFESAEKDFLKFLAWDTGNWAAYNDLSWIYFQWGKFKEAEEVARKGLTLNPGNVWLLNMRGVALLNLGDKETAKILFMDAFEKAEKLMEADWHRAYPGNDPVNARQGLREMTAAIRLNLKRASP